MARRYIPAVIRAGPFSHERTACLHYVDSDGIPRRIQVVAHTEHFDLLNEWLEVDLVTTQGRDALVTLPGDVYPVCYGNRIYYPKNQLIRCPDRGEGG